MTYYLDKLPAEQYKIITKKTLLAAKLHDGSIAKLFYAGIPVFLCDLGHIDSLLSVHVSKSLRDPSALSRVRAYLKAHAKCIETTEK